MRVRVLLVLVLLAAFGSWAQAGPITVVDTGPGPGSDQAGVGLFNNGTAYQWLAAEFTVNSSVTVTSALGWMWFSTRGTLTVGLYSDGGTVPGSELFSADVVPTGSQYVAAWQGPTDVSWVLTPGTYWIGYTVPTSGFSGAMPQGVASPLTVEDYNASWGLGWLAVTGGDFGVRILGDGSTTPVPEPASLLLLGTGLAGLVAARRRRH